MPGCGKALLATGLLLAGCALGPRHDPSGGDPAVAARAPGPSLPAQVAAAAMSGPSALRYDGVYHGPRRYVHGAWMRTYLRFYPDGRVVVVPSARGLDGIAAWLTRDNPTLDAADAAIDGPRVSFVLAPEDEALAFDGVATADGLVLETRKPHTGLRHSMVFRFTPLPRATLAAGRVPFDGAR
ncbi:MAG: hypothetical protein JNK67_32220 [Alphaproteobacteria bacterium]|nr:hypothetical protein [Alphaproteobacteria bacterium]